jgi:ligand-binding sensor domain-containing protein/signal transduction histidine kinase
MKSAWLIESKNGENLLKLKPSFKTVVLCVAFMIILNLKVFSQQDEFQFVHFTAEDGLSLNAVTKIIQDDNGFLWFGTYNGLNRYDGYNFKIFLPEADNPKSISNHSIWALLKDNKGFIWVGTLDGLNRYDWKTEQFILYRNNPKDPNSLSNNNITSIYEDKSGTLWIGTINGLNKYNRDKDNFTVIKKVTDRFNSNSLNTVTCIEEDRNGNLWLGTWNGLSCMQKDGKIIKDFFSDAFDSKILNYRQISTLYEDDENNLWIGTEENGLKKYNHTTGKIVNYLSVTGNPNTISNANITSIFKDKSGNFWVGTRDGLNKYNYQKDNFIRILHDRVKPLSIASNEILSIYQDNTGLVWIGNAGGLSRYYQPANIFNYYDQANVKSDKNLISNRVHSVIIDKNGNLWVATFEGLDEIVKGTNTVIHHRYDPHKINNISENFVMSVMEDDEGNIWAGTSFNGLNKYNPKTNKFQLYKYDNKNIHSISNNGIVSLCEGHNGCIWVGTWWGLNRYDKNTGTFERYFHIPGNPNSLCHDLIWAILEDSKGMMWFGTDGGGASEFNPKSNEFITFSKDSTNINRISENRVFNIFESHDGVIWLGTSEGLNEYDKSTGKITIYNKSNGLPGNSICSVLEDDKGYIWISSDKGLSKLDRKTGHFTNYTKRNGLKELEFIQNVSARSKDRLLYFGSKKGIMYFNPANIKDETLDAPIVLTDLKVFNQSVPITEKGILTESVNGIKSISVPSGNDVITLEFALLDYFDVKRNTFRYKLAGFDQDWNDVGTRNNATYTNLPPGEYTFLVRASNSNGIKNEKETAVKLIIIPKFYQEWWFSIVVGLASIFIILVVFQVRTQSIQKQNKILENRVIERTKDLDKTIKELNSEIGSKDKFFSIIAHDLRSPFMALLGFSNHMAEEVDVLSKEEIKTIAENILKSTKVTFELLENLLHWARIKTGRIIFEPEIINLKNTIEETIELFRNNALSKDIELCIDIDPGTKIYADLNMIETILRNLIANSLKFTNKGGRIDIFAKEKKDCVVIRILDTGVGISPDNIDKLFQIGKDTSSLGTQNERGSGLGLILCKEFVEMNKGKITVESKVGKGSVFSFTIPVAN